MRIFYRRWDFASHGMQSMQWATFSILYETNLILMWIQFVNSYKPLSSVEVDTQAGRQTRACVILNTMVPRFETGESGWDSGPELFLCSWSALSLFSRFWFPRWSNPPIVSEPCRGLRMPGPIRRLLISFAHSFRSWQKNEGKNGCATNIVGIITADTICRNPTALPFAKPVKKFRNGNALIYRDQGQF